MIMQCFAKEMFQTAGRYAPYFYLQLGREKEDDTQGIMITIL